MSTCYRHPGKKAKRKCFRCRQVICFDCHYRRDHHIFCGRECHLRFAVTDRKEWVSGLLQRSLPLPVMVAALLALVAPLAYVFLAAAIELDAPIVRFVHQHKVDTVSGSIERIEEGERSMSVEGAATPGAIVVLLQNGKAEANQVADVRGHFAFMVDLPKEKATFAVAAIPATAFNSASFAPAAKINPAILRDVAVRSASTRYVESLTRGPADSQNIVLSFDAGSTDEGAREILDTLRAHGIHTTIFLTGEFIQKYPQVVKEIAADGHEVGNHTWSHPHMTTFERNHKQLTLAGMTRERFQNELQRTADAYRLVTGREMSKFWRAPFGEENNEIRGWAAELGYTHVGWTTGRKYNLDSLDWVADASSPIYFTADQVASRMLNFDLANNTTLNGGIILMHLGSDRREALRVEKALPMMIEKFEAKGFHFVKVSELKGSTANAG